MRKQRASSPFMKEALSLSKKAPVIPWGENKSFVALYEYISVYP